MCYFISIDILLHNSISIDTQKQPELSELEIPSTKERTAKIPEAAEEPTSNLQRVENSGPTDITVSMCLYLAM